VAPSAGQVLEPETRPPLPRARRKRKATTAFKGALVERAVSCSTDLRKPQRHNPEVAERALAFVSRFA